MEKGSFPLTCVCVRGRLAFGLAFRSSCGDVARAGGYHPRGHACGDPLRKGREERPFTYCPSGRVGLRLEVSDSTSCLSGNGRPSLAGPCGLFPLAALAYGYRPRGWYPPALPSTEVG